MSRPEDPAAGKNPPYGASLDYYLKSVPTGDIKITILDDKGQPIKSFAGTKEPGINRVWWDIKHESSQQIRLRTSPLYAPHIGLGLEDWRPYISLEGQVTPLAAPGTYVVKLTVGRQEITQKLAVKKDPNSAGSEADIQEQSKLLLEIRNDSNSVVDMVNQIEWIRKQINDLAMLLKEKKDELAIKTAIEEIDKKLMAVEENLIQLRHTGASQDNLRFPVKLYDKLGSLADDIGNTDFPPTTQEVEVHKMFKAQLATSQDQLHGLLTKDLPAFNNLIKENGIPNIIIVKAP